MIDTRAAVAKFRSLESLAVIPRVSSTNLVARRIVDECVANDLSLPHAMIIAGEQFAGRGRYDRRWSSPAGKGIYATMLLTRSTRALPLVPLEMANVVASFLRDVFSIDARVKWPNDVLAGGRKIAGILTEARIQDDRAYVIVGTGINVEPAENDDRPNAVAMREVSPRDFRGVDEATAAFVEHVDERLSRPIERECVLAEWRGLTVHAPGDRITCVVAGSSFVGTWSGLDDEGRALLRRGEEIVPVSAGEFILGA